MRIAPGVVASGRCRLPMIRGNLGVEGWQDSCVVAWQGWLNVASHPRVAVALPGAGARIRMRGWFTDEFTDEPQ
jgi:hypothetical protein